MINVAEFIYETRIGKFVCSTKAELDKLPRINTPGQDNLNTFKSCAQGSMAKVITGDDAGFYMLDGATNTWIKQSGSGGGGGGDIDPTDIADREDIDSIFGF